jgi:hypothetical protein
MAISLYDASVATYLQTLGAVAAFLEKTASHAATHGLDLAKLVETRLYSDMLPFRFQIVSVAHHSIGALQGVQAGVFRPPAPPPGLDYGGLQKLVAEARESLGAMSRAEVDALLGRDVVFEIAGRQVPFTAEGFILSFSLPNFFFHAATAYDILRMQGVPVGKRDFMGRLRIKT